MSVFPGVCIRLCQFHIIQALLRWTTDDDNSPLKDRKGPRLKIKGKRILLDAFRHLQRARSSEPNPTKDQDEQAWSEAKEEFLQTLEDICDKYGSDGMYSKIQQYFEVNWFCNEWRGMRSFRRLML